MTDTSFFDVWDTYHKVVAGDHMFHRAIGAELRAALETRFAGRPYQMLDLGCGDAFALAPLLEGLAPAAYHGIDLSEAALALAAKNLSLLPCPVTLERVDMLSALDGTAPVDVIYSSFALHHLDTAQKAKLFARVSDKLTPGGLLLLVDVTREEGQALPDYRAAYCDWIRAAWTGLAPAEREMVCDHLCENDMPEPYSVLAAQARAAGLAPLPGAARHKWHRLMAFEKPTAVSRPTAFTRP